MNLSKVNPFNENLNDCIGQTVSNSPNCWQLVFGMALSSQLLTFDCFTCE